MLQDNIEKNKRKFKRTIFDNQTKEVFSVEERQLIFTDLYWDLDFFEWVRHYDIFYRCCNDKPSYKNCEEGWVGLYDFRFKVMDIKGLIADKTNLMDFIDEITSNDEEVIQELHGDYDTIGYLEIINFYELEHDCLKIGELEE